MVKNKYTNTLLSINCIEIIMHVYALFTVAKTVLLFCNASIDR